MTNSEVKRILDGIGISTSGSETGFIQIPTLKYFNLVSDGNHVISYYNDMINFDFDHEIINIKEKSCYGISGIINTNGANISSSSILIKYSPILNKKYTFRRFRTGDKVFYVNKSTLKHDTTLDDTITSITGPFISVKKTIPDLNLYYMCYADNDKFNTAVLSPEDNRLALVYTDDTRYVSDVYLSFECLAGFSFQSSTSSII